jgi:hypothetical protein
VFRKTSRFVTKFNPHREATVSKYDTPINTILFPGRVDIVLYLEAGGGGGLLSSLANHESLFFIFFGKLDSPGGRHCALFRRWGEEGIFGESRITSSSSSKTSFCSRGV